MKYTEKLADGIAELVADGMSPTRAGLLMDVSGETVSEWKRTRSDFAAKIEKAKARYIQRLVKRIDKAGETDWKASMALLERRAPDEFGRESRQKPVADPVMEQKAKTNRARDAAALALSESPLFQGYLQQEAQIILARGETPAGFRIAGLERIPNPSDDGAHGDPGAADV